MASHIAMDYLEVWNGKFAELLEDLTVLFGDDPDLLLLRTGFALARAAAKDSAWRVFRDHVEVPYGAKVLAKDESFFMTFVLGDDTRVLGIVDRVRRAWKDLSPANRDVIWQYFTLLVQLSARVTRSP